MENRCYNINVRTRLSFPKSQFPALRGAYPPFAGFNFRSSPFFARTGCPVGRNYALLVT